MTRQQDIKNKIAELTRELESLQEFPAHLLPEGANVVHFNSPLAKYFVTYKVNTLDEVKALVSQIWNGPADVLPLSLCRSGYTVSFLTPYHGRNGDITPVFPVTVTVDQHHLEFKMYVLLNDYLTQIKFVFESGFSGYACVRYTQKQWWHKVKNVRLEHSWFKNPEVIQWASGSPTTPPSFTMYWTTINSFDQMFEE